MGRSRRSQGGRPHVCCMVTTEPQTARLPVRDKRMCIILYTLYNIPRLPPQGKRHVLHAARCCRNRQGRFRQARRLPGAVGIARPYR